MSVKKHSLIFSGGTLLSRVSGLVRDMVVAGVFGATNLLDAFIIANRIPNLFREMLAEGALGSAFTKVYSELSETDSAKAQALLRQALQIGVILTVLISIIGYLSAPYLVKAFTLMAERSERGEAFFVNAISLTRLLFPFLGFAMLSAIVMGTLHQKGRFFLTSISPTLLNFGYILGASVFAWSLMQHPDFAIGSADPGLVGLALGVLLGGFLQFLAQFLGLGKELKHLVVVDRSLWPVSRELRRVLTIMAPAAIAASAGSINLLVNTNFAAGLQAGAVTWLNYSFRLLQLPVGVFGVAVSMAVLPALTRAITHARGVVDAKASLQLQQALEFILWLMVPSLVFIQANSNELITLIFRHGNFTENAAYATAQALYAYSFALIAYGLIKVLTAFYFSVERTRYAMMVSMGTIGVNFLANLYLVRRFEHIGLAAATAVTLSFNALFLLVGLRVNQPRFQYRELVATLGSLVVGFWLCSGLQHVLDAKLAAMFAGLHYKLQSLSLLLVNGILVVCVFLFIGSIRYRVSPRVFFERFRK